MSSNKEESSGRPVSDSAEWEKIKEQAIELLDYFFYYLEARVDTFKFHGRQFLDHLFMKVAALVVATGAIVAATTLIFIGIAQGLAQVFTNKPWLGTLITGLMLLGITSLAVWLWLAGMRKAAYNHVVEKYEQRKSRQQTRFGHDVAGRAKAAQNKP